ncbi:AraC family transcriptional regulator [Hymenobacter chitinivorans]|uniref:AraC-like DNA-binding protein n=1 Tax=Hymenobacter chitinivorans DSM 11115 TaxID=1121954 RepID=A0A2M9BQK8_9BACT|nr:helix-turn-helix domain-containing protein [Hymenobacter chitinivorans]PJJ60229.1 AraC-like DNA-binding protein [Hymenobacter chitinivorans DSM 11115]
MHFQQFAPPEPLQAYVRYFWRLEHSSPEPATFHTIVDGCPGLILQAAGSAPICDPVGKLWPEVLLYGQATRATQLRAGGAFALLGACLYPGTERLLFHLRADELTNTCLDVELLPAGGRRFRQQLQSIESPDTRLAQLCVFLLRAVGTTPASLEPGIQYALQQLIASRGALPLGELLAGLPFSERSFQRKFQEYVGVSPKLFARICRFQTTLTQLRAAQYDKLSDLALANDYADQSHHIRAFREFAGVAPHQYATRTREVLENLTLVL